MANINIEMADSLGRIASVLEKELPKLNSNLKNLNNTLTGEGGLDASAGYIGERLEEVSDVLEKIADKT